MSSVAACCQFIIKTIEDSVKHCYEKGFTLSKEYITKIKVIVSIHLLCYNRFFDFQFRYDITVNQDYDQCFHKEMMNQNWDPDIYNNISNKSNYISIYWANENEMLLTMISINIFLYFVNEYKNNRKIQFLFKILDKTEFNDYKFEYFQIPISEIKYQNLMNFPNFSDNDTNNIYKNAILDFTDMFHILIMHIMRNIYNIQGNNSIGKYIIKIKTASLLSQNLITNIINLYKYYGITSQNENYNLYHFSAHWSLLYYIEPWCHDIMW